MQVAFETAISYNDIIRGDLMNLLFLILLSLCSNCWLAVKQFPLLLLIILPSFLTVNFLAGITVKTAPTKSMKLCAHGVSCLKLFSFSMIISVLYHIGLVFNLQGKTYIDFIISTVVCIIVLAIIFWNGIISVYCTSRQLGIKHRIIGIICGPIPIANLVVLAKIIKITSKEIKTEYQKELVNQKRKDLKICKTKYPILLVHGVFFRDSDFFNYWGRIPKELERNGATIHYGEHESAASIENSAKELCNRIIEIIQSTNCEKVNIIAHSKGGLDCRYAIEHLGIAPLVASLTTVNTPHRGCLFADFLLEKSPENLKNKIADTYNSTLRKMGDKDPDFLSAVNDLTASACKKFLDYPQKIEGIYCQSIGSEMKKASNGKFPLNFSYHLVKYFDGKNDGLVAEESFKWGEKYTYLTPTGNRGISHGDMIDLNRENIDGFDVREFYVKLVSELKTKGL